MATHSSILAWRIPWTEEPGGIQSIGSHRVGCDRNNSMCAKSFMNYLNRKYLDQQCIQCTYENVL